MGLTFNYLLSNERTSLINNNIVRETLYPGGNSYKTLGVYLGANHKFTENWEFNLLGGMNIIKSDFDTQVEDLSQFPYFTSVAQKRVQHTKGTPYFTVFTTYRWTNLSLMAGFSRDQTPSAYGYVLNFTRVYASLGYTITERLTGTLGGSFSSSSQASQTDNLDYNYYSVTGLLAYRITENLSVTPGYRFSQYDDVTGGRSAQAHSAYVMLTYSYPMHYQN
jgi:hypothetical protein